MSPNIDEQENIIAAPRASLIKRILAVLLFIASLALLFYAYTIWRQLG